MKKNVIALKSSLVSKILEFLPPPPLNGVLDPPLLKLFAFNSFWKLTIHLLSKRLNSIVIFEMDECVDFWLEDV